MRTLGCLGPPCHGGWAPCFAALPMAATAIRLRSPAGNIAIALSSAEELGDGRPFSIPGAAPFWPAWSRIGLGPDGEKRGGSYAQPCGSAPWPIGPFSSGLPGQGISTRLQTALNLSDPRVLPCSAGVLLLDERLFPLQWWVPACPGGGGLINQKAKRGPPPPRLGGKKGPKVGGASPMSRSPREGCWW